MVSLFTDGAPYIMSSLSNVQCYISRPDRSIQLATNHSCLSNFII